MHYHPSKLYNCTESKVSQVFFEVLWPFFIGFFIFIFATNKFASIKIKEKPQKLQKASLRVIFVTVLIFDVPPLSAKFRPNIKT